jgi:hypothetical protein
MSWLDAWAYLEFERANGMRFPPTMAALRGAGFWVAGFSVVATGTSGSGLIGRYRQYQVLSVT